ncbi:MAG: peptide deformylase [Nitrospirae bacterium]|nr:peptide deformylase [Nitrospirota bacterium]
MAILKIAEIGNPILRQVARPVPDDKVRSEAVQLLIDDMIETMREYDGAGLAAPQVRHSVQIVVYEAAANPRYPEAPSIPLTVLINPTVTLLPGPPEGGWEGCLSIPEMRGIVPRARSVRVKALDRLGRPVDFTVEGFHARVIQHETDHLQGILFVDRMPDLKSLARLNEFHRFWMKPGEAEPAET